MRYMKLLMPTIVGTLTISAIQSTAHAAPTQLSKSAKMIQAATAEILKEKSNMSDQAQIGILSVKLGVDAVGNQTATVQISLPNPAPMNCEETTLILTPSTTVPGEYDAVNPDAGDRVGRFCKPL
jgi:hypothetical protein